MTNAIMTKELVEQAIEIVEQTMPYMVESNLAIRVDLHIVVMNPAVPYSPETAFEDAVFYERSIGNTSRRDSPFYDIARGKAALSWRTGLPSHHIQQFAPHLYQDGDVRHGGSVVFEGIIVACSGVQSHFDRMYAEMIASAIRALSVHAFQAYIENNPPSFFGVNIDS